MNSFLLASLIPLAALPIESHEFDQAYQQSLGKGQPLVVLVGADWCPGCRVMSQRVLPQVARDGGFDDVAFAYVNFDRQRQLASTLVRGRAIPQMIRLQKTSKGWEKQYLTGVHPPEKVAEFIRNGDLRQASFVNTPPVRQASHLLRK